MLLPAIQSPHQALLGSSYFKSSSLGAIVTRLRRESGYSRHWRKNCLNVREQIGEGAKSFVLVTNLSGTAHPKSGSIDKLQVLLDEHIPIPALAWWRYDLDRRLDGEWDLKVTHGLFSGMDFLRLVVESSPSEDRERRRNAIIAFLSDQFDSDREVKFKQVELENDLFDLFTDVPVVPRNPAERRKTDEDRLAAAFRRAASSETGEFEAFRVHQWLEIALGRESRFGGYYPRDETWMGAASLLLDTNFQQAVPLVILEGAPGQGKSTIAQYICQVHRMRILERQEHSTVESAHLTSSLRLPFKVELRDFASWLSGVNSFDNADGSDSPDSPPRSLEGFFVGPYSVLLWRIQLRRRGSARHTKFVTYSHCP